MLLSPFKSHQSHKWVCMAQGKHKGALCLALLQLILVPVIGEPRASFLRALCFPQVVSMAYNTVATGIFLHVTETFPRFCYSAHEVNLILIWMMVFYFFFYSALWVWIHRGGLDREIKPALKNRARSSSCIVPLANFCVYHSKRGFLQGFDNKAGTPCQFFTHKGENGTV